jgi:hypothetical protein
MDSTTAAANPGQQSDGVGRNLAKEEDEMRRSTIRVQNLLKMKRFVSEYTATNVSILWLMPAAEAVWECLLNMHKRTHGLQLWVLYSILRSPKIQHIKAIRAGP